jgi:signal transduction histidine kinase
MRTLLGEMTWALGEDTAPESLIEYEAKLSDFVRDHEVRILCKYNRDRFSPELTLAVIRTHPVVVYGGMIRQNPYYVPPDEFLKPNQASREVERLLNNILTGQHSLAQLHALAARLKTVGETERKRLALELHDEIGQLLTGLRLRLNPNDASPAGALKSRLEQARTIVDDLLARVRRLSFDLRPADLDQFGLLPALLSLFERYTAQTGVLVNFKHQGVERRFEPEVETGAYRIVQEALTNAARHAGVGSITVRVWSDAGQPESSGRRSGSRLRSGGGAESAAIQRPYRYAGAHHAARRPHVDRVVRGGRDDDRRRTAARLAESWSGKLKL